MRTAPKSCRDQRCSSGCGAGYGRYSSATSASVATRASSPRQADSTAGVTEYMRAFAIQELMLRKFLQFSRRGPAAQGPAV